MPVYELTVAPSYVDWGVWEGVRELLQNAKDSEEADGHAMTVSYNQQSKWLSIRNKGALLEKRHLVLGETDKRGLNVRGWWGEGFKLAWAALLRAGKEIWVQNGDERWEPRVQWSEKFGTQVLAVEVKKGTAKKDLAVEVGNISADEWDEIRHNCLFISPPKEVGEVEEVGANRVLLDPRHAHRVYCRGLLVSNHYDLGWGYDLCKLKLDRDRRMIDSYELDNQVREILHALLIRGGDPSIMVYEILNAETALATMEARACARSWDDPSPAFKEVVAMFRATYGEKARPVARIEDGTEMPFYGYTPVVAGPGIVRAFEAQEGTFERVKAQLRFNVKNYQEGRDADLAMLKDLASFADGYQGVTFSTIPVRFGEFVDPTILGKYSGDGIVLSSALQGQEVIATWIHEAAHRIELRDGTPRHLEAIQGISARIIGGLVQMFK